MSESVAVSAVRVAVLQFDPQVGTHNIQTNLQNGLDLDERSQSYCAPGVGQHRLSVC